MLTAAMGPDPLPPAVPETPAPEEARPRFGWGFALKLAVTVGCLAWVLRSVDLGALGGHLLRLSPGWAGTALAVWLATQWASGFRWARISAPMDLGCPHPEYIRLYFVGGFFNAFLPTLIGGDVVKAYYLARLTGQRSRSAVSVFMDRDAGMAGLLLVGTAASAIAPLEFQGVTLFPLMAALLAGYLALNAVLFAPPFHRLAAAAARRTGWDWAARKLRNVLGSLSVYNGHLGTLLSWALLSAGIQWVSFVAIWCLGRGIGVPLGLAVYLVVVPLIGVLTLLPISIGGLGLRESAFLVLFSSAGLPPEQGVALSLLWYALMMAGGLPGLYYYLKRRR